MAGGGRMTRQQVSRKEINAARTPGGAWTKKQLAEWGVPWPPPRGWKKRLAASPPPPPRPDYQEYLRSDAWKRRRAPIFAAAKGRCLGCDRPAECVHHRSYERLGHEVDADLVALCWDCHRDCHLHHVEHADMGLWAATNALITERRALFGLPPVKLPSEKSARPLTAKGQQRSAQQKAANAIPVNSPARVEIRSVRCPKCAAHIGELCQSSSGNPRPANHARRVEEYQRQSRGEPPSRIRSANRRFHRGGRHRRGGGQRASTAT